MIDCATNEPVRVSSDGDAGPYILVTVDQLDDVQRVLDRHGIAYWVDDDAISLDDKPAVTVVNLRRDLNSQEIQAILDQSS